MKFTRLARPACSPLVVSMVWGMATLVVAQRAGDKKTPIPGPMLNQGTVNYDTPDFTLSLVRSSQTVAALKPKRADGFDFTPGGLLTKRSQDGYFHLGRHYSAPAHDGHPG
ncbi:MAG TPA: DUF5695 domain-containing protein [Candidatus Acidoferrum sp.]|nr:DUF5695 domain-containing protein [Candidatus Acidoferrum sp.]